MEKDDEEYFIRLKIDDEFFFVFIFIDKIATAGVQENFGINIKNTQELLLMRVSSTLKNNSFVDDYRQKKKFDAIASIICRQKLLDSQKNESRGETEKLPKVFFSLFLCILHYFHTIDDHRPFRERTSREFPVFSFDIIQYKCFFYTF
jgi:hypothetical protein